MRLYMFERCSLCFRVRMAAALKRLHLQETVVLDDDSDTMIGLVGKRVIPILVKDDGQPMLESMDMVAYVDSLGDPLLTGSERNEVAVWANKVVAKTAPCSSPREIPRTLPAAYARLRAQSTVDDRDLPLPAG